MKVPLWETSWNFINSALKISLFEIVTVLLIIAVSFLLNQKTLKILGSKLQTVHIKRFPECKSFTKLKLDIQCHLEYMLEIIYALPNPAEIRILKIVRQSLQILSGQVLKQFASIGSLTSIKRVMKSQILIVMPPPEWWWRS